MRHFLICSSGGPTGPLTYQIDIYARFDFLEVLGIFQQLCMSVKTEEWGVLEPNAKLRYSSQCQRDGLLFTQVPGFLFIVI